MPRRHHHDGGTHWYERPLNSGANGAVHTERGGFFQNHLYVSVKNGGTGIELWRSADGSLWEQANQDGFGDGNNTSSNGSNATVGFLSHLYVGTANVVDGGELWRMQQPSPPPSYADLSIGKRREGAGAVVAGGAITYTLTVTNAGPTAPVTATVVDAWLPVTAVVGAEAPGCSTDLAGGLITCTVTGLGLDSTFVPPPHLVLTTSQAFSGILSNTARVEAVGGVIDPDGTDNASGPVIATVLGPGHSRVYLPLVLR